MIKTIRFDDGAVTRIEVPDDATNEQINSFVNANWEAIKAKAKPMVQQRETYEYSDPNRGSALNSLLRGATFDFADEAMGGVAATYARIHDLITGKDSGVTYADAVESIRRDQEAFGERNPILDTTLQVAGGFATGGTGGAKVLGSKTLKELPSFMQKAAVPAIAGFEGALYGLGSGETGEERLQNALIQGGTGMLLAPLLNKVGQTVGKKFFGKEGRKLQQEIAEDATAESVEKRAKDLYKQADRAGVRIKSEAYKEFAEQFLQELEDEAIDGATYPMVGKAIKRLKELEYPSYKDIAGVKRMLKNARTSRDPDVSRIGGMMNAKIDEFIENLIPENLISGNIDDLAGNLAEAKGLWSKKAQVEIIDEAMDKAKRAEINVKEGDLDAAIRQKIRPLVENPKISRSLDPEVVSSLDDVIQGKAGKKAVREIAKLNPGARTHRGLLVSLGSGAGVMAATGSPAGLLAAAAPGMLGTTAKWVANKMSRKEIDQIRNAILNKGRPEAEEIIQAILEPYQPMIQSLNASAAAQASDETITTLEDMLQ